MNIPRVNSGAHWYYMLRRWDLFARFLDDGRICLTNNAAERALRGIALGRKSWLFAGSDRGGVRAAAMYTLIGTAKLNNVDPQAWLADVLDRIAGTPQSQLDELLPWNWQDSQRHDQAAYAETSAWRFLTGNAPPPNSAPNTPRPSADAYDEPVEHAATVRHGGHFEQILPAIPESMPQRQPLPVGLTVDQDPFDSGVGRAQV